jgi:putative PEP-CTERM system histidine kinase
MSMTEFGAISYAVVAAFYAVLSVLLLTNWRGHRIGAFLVAATLASTAWGLVLALQTAGLQFSFPLVFIVEVVRSGAWITFLVVLASRIGVSHGVRYVCLIAWLSVLLVGFVGLVVFPAPRAYEVLGDVIIPGGLVIALIGLFLIEQLYRNSSHEARWGIKALALGLGGVFAFDLFLYSQAMLFGALDSNTWLARGSVNILFVPLIVVAARRSPSWDLEIFVSRQVVFYSTTLVAVGLYLLLMSAGGYAIVLYGGSWGAVIQVVFFVGALLVLALLLFSSTLRARTKVFLSKHFFQNKYDYREEWLRLVSTLSEFGDSSTRQIVIKAMAQIVDSPSGALWILDEDSQVYRVAACYATTQSFPDLAVTDEIIVFMSREGWLIDLDEYEEEPARYQHLALGRWLDDDEDAWLLVPLITNQRLLGIILLNHGRIAMTLNYEDRDLLKTVGSHIAVQLAQEKSDALLTEARQFEAYNRLTAFLMHDLNNLIAQQSLIVSNAEKHKRNPEFVDDAMQTIANSVERMKRVMDQLKGRDIGRTAKPEEIRHLLTAAVDRCADRMPKPGLILNGVEAKHSVDPEQFTMVLAHLIKNAQDATTDDGRVEVELLGGKGHIEIEIRDDGAGMSPEFVRDRLFRPFDSTKGSQGMGIGAYQAREFARRIGGDLTVSSEPSVGTTIKISVPANRDNPTD